MAAALHLAVFALLTTISLALPTVNISRAAVSTRCMFPGIFCLDCHTLALCVDIDDKFLEYQIEMCEDSKPCSSSLHVCSEKASFCTNPDITSNYFKCVQEGLFPDPYDCNVYHQCDGSNSAEYPATRSYTCAENTAYNPKTGQCDLPANNALCGEDAYPVPKCESGAFDLGTLAIDPHYYWICHDEDIHIIKCKDGTIFTGTACVPEGEEATEQPSEETSEESEERPCGMFQCAGRGKEPDPQSCTRFYDCSDPKQPIRSACPWAHYFNQRKRRCALGSCPY